MPYYYDRMTFFGDGLYYVYCYDKFIEACKTGDIKWAQELYFGHNINIHTHDDYAFRLSCDAGHLPTSQWLYGIGGVNIHAENEDAFRSSCRNGHLATSQWIYGLQGVNIHADNDDAFRSSCRNGHLPISQWLFSLGICMYDHQERISMSQDLINYVVWFTTKNNVNNFAIIEMNRINDTNLRKQIVGKIQLFDTSY